MFCEQRLADTTGFEFLFHYFIECLIVGTIQLGLHDVQYWCSAKVLSVKSCSSHGVQTSVNRTSIVEAMKGICEFKLLVSSFEHLIRSISSADLDHHCSLIFERITVRHNGNHAKTNIPRGRSFSRLCIHSPFARAAAHSLTRTSPF